MKPKTLCAVYTRKSTDERLDMEFNTLDAQREACEAYITSQKSEGWTLSPEHYDDGGFSGGSLERPALEKLIQDIKASKVNVIVVYKIDRLTRSLTDFAKLVDVFDEHGVTFVSVTQSFNTTTSMGRLTLNVLLSFAQFEREVTGERIRDKIAASKAKGMWMGSRPPLGYDIDDRRLIVNPDDAPKVKLIYEQYLKLGCVKKLQADIEKRGITSRQRISVKKGHQYGGHPFGRGALYGILKNPVYLGKITHKGKIHEGLHPGIIEQDLWDKVQERLKEGSVRPRGHKKHMHTNVLQGLLFDEKGHIYTPVFTNKSGKKYRYYVNQELASQQDHPNKMLARLPAHEIESVVEGAMRNNLHQLLTISESHIEKHVLENQSHIPTHELVTACVTKIEVQHSNLTITLTPQNLPELIKQYLNVNVSTIFSPLTLEVPYQVKRIRDGAVIIQSKEKDIFDLPKQELKKLVQGHIWRDEHFSGTSIADIARRESFSSRYIRNCIIYSFDILSEAPFTKHYLNPKD